MTENDKHPLSRRGFVMGGAGACVLLGMGGLKAVPQQAVCRPPGGQDFDALLSGCIHCEKCREVCPKGAIAPAHLEDGILSVRMPKMDFTRGWCDFCENEPGGPRCAAVCPTGALKPTANTVIGVAQVHYDWCLANRGMGCHDCIDACPYEAIEINDNHTPRVLEDKCNGCGRCENVCPSMSNGSLSGTLDEEITDRAITVVPVQG